MCLLPAGCERRPHRNVSGFAHPFYLVRIQSQEFLQRLGIQGIRCLNAPRLHRVHCFLSRPLQHISQTNDTQTLQRNSTSEARTEWGAARDNKETATVVPVRVPKLELAWETWIRSEMRISARSCAGAPDISSGRCRIPLRLPYERLLLLQLLDRESLFLHQFFRRAYHRRPNASGSI